MVSFERYDGENINTNFFQVELWLNIIKIVGHKEREGED
jgi:hypothetical protein